MTESFWKTPAFELPINTINKIVIFRISSKSIVTEKNWPNDFLDCVTDKTELSQDLTNVFIENFAQLEPSSAARCHMPSWGFAAYNNNGLVFTATMCFECDNAYIYTVTGKILRAFLVEHSTSEKLFEIFGRFLPLEPS